MKVHLYPLKGGLVVVEVELTTDPACESRLLLVVVLLGFFPPIPRDPFILSNRPAFFVVVVVLGVAVVVLRVVVAFFPPIPRDPFIRSNRPAFFVVVVVLGVVVVVLRVVVAFFPPSPKDPLSLSTNPAFFVVVLTVEEAFLVGFLVVLPPVGFLGQILSCLHVTPSCTTKHTSHYGQHTTQGTPLLASFMSLQS